MGVQIDSNLSWKPHIDYISKKIAKACGALSKIRHCVDINTLMNIYYALVHSYLRYGIIAWGNASLSNLKPLQAMLNRVVRIMCFAPFGRIDLKPLYSCLEILDVSKIFLLETGKFIYKSKNGMLPINNIAKHFERRVGASHQYNLREHRSYELPRILHHTAEAQKSIQIKGHELWNEIPQEIRNGESLRIFKTHYKSHLLSEIEVLNLDNLF